MDTDISRWICEFLMRSTAVQDNVIKNLLQVLPLSSSAAAAAKDSLFKETVLLRTIQSEISDATVTEATLQALELIEEMDRSDGVEEIGDSMKEAYCVVAVECTVKYLALGGSDGKYFEAVKRVWRGRIGNLEKSGNKCNLVRDNAELTRWKNDLEAALLDAEAAKRLMSLNTRTEALQKLRAFLREAWALMGPSFIEAAADTSSGAGELVVEQEDKFAAGKGTHKGNVLPRRKHTECHKRSKGGVRIFEEEDTDTLCSKYDSLPTSEFNKIKEALKSSSLELQAVVKDPHPDALRPAESVMSDMVKKDKTLEPSAENQSGKDINALNPSVDKNVAPQATASGCGNQSCIPQSNSTGPSLMERNSTAHTYEWDDSIDDSQEGMTDRASRLHLPNPKRKIVSPLRKYEVKKFVRRKNRRWSLLEEDTLRAGVQKFGKGNWKLILNSHPDIFEERTEVDLKDKWRNMTRYLGSMDTNTDTGMDMGTTR